MSIATRSELESSIRTWLNRLESDTDLVPFIPDFITLAEAEMRADLDARILRTSTALEEMDGLETDLPGDYGSVLVVYLYSSVNNNDVLEYELRNATQKEIARMSREEPSGNPRRYWIEGSKINFFPQIDPLTSLAGDRLQWQMTYRQDALLGPAPTDTNDLLKQWPNLYLYGALAHSAPFLEEDQRAAVWGGLYNNAVTKINDDAAYSEAGTSQISMPELR